MAKNIERNGVHVAEKKVNGIEMLQIHLHRQVLKDIQLYILREYIFIIFF